MRGFPPRTRISRRTLKRASCEKIVLDVANGKIEARSGLEKLRELMRMAT